MRIPRTVRELEFEIAFQQRNLELFAKWPTSCEASRQLITLYETQLQELLRPRALPREKDPEDRAA
jgi:hypothetical protein